MAEDPDRPERGPVRGAADASTLGCFAGGYAEGRPQGNAAGNGTLMIVVAVAIGFVVLAGIPLLMLRRRRHEPDR